MSDIKIVGEDGQELVANESKPVSDYKISYPVTSELEQGAVASTLDLEGGEINKYSDEIGLLLNYAKSQVKDSSLESLKWVIRDLELKLGSPPLGEKKIHLLSRYVFLLNEESTIKKERQRFEKIG